MFFSVWIPEKQICFRGINLWEDAPSQVITKCIGTWNLTRSPINVDWGQLFSLTYIQIISLPSLPANDRFNATLTPAVIIIILVVKYKLFYKPSQSISGWRILLLYKCIDCSWYILTLLQTIRLLHDHQSLESHWTFELGLVCLQCNIFLNKLGNSCTAWHVRILNSVVKILYDLHNFIYTCKQLFFFS